MDIEWSNERHEKMHEAWKMFTKSGVIDKDIVRPIIANSWERCKNYNVDPYADINVSSSKNISTRLYNSGSLVKSAYPFISALNQTVKGSGFRVNLADKEGYFLISEGDKDVLQKTSILNRHIGLCRNEPTVGTCGISLALVENKPVQVNSFEHYNVRLHEWTCSTAPIHGPNGDIVGVFNVSGHYSLVHRHTLGMVMGITRAIELALKNSESLDKLNHYRNITDLIINNIYEGLVVFDEEGKISHSNQKGLKILKSIVGEENILNFQLVKNANKIFQAKHDIIDKEVSAVMGRRRNTFYMTLQTINRNDNKRKYNCLFFKDQEKITKITQQLYEKRAYYNFSDIIGLHKTVINAIKEAKFAAKSNCPVLIIGETGTGKEMLAQSIHNFSERQEGPFVAINCGAIPAGLIESELFGYEAGSFTDARKGGKPGKIEIANGGTLFLDELDSMPINMQTKLLRVLQNKRVNKIGGECGIPVDIRLISASKKELLDEVKKGTFRDDFFFRVNIITIHLPLLKNRKSDIPLLCNYFLKRLISQNYKPIQGISPEALRSLINYDWPGNVRELEGCLERAYVFEEGEYITQKSLPSYIYENTKVKYDDVIDESTSLEDYECKLIKKTLLDCDGNVSKAARLLGIGRDTLYRKMHKFDIGKVKL